MSATRSRSRSPVDKNNRHSRSRSRSRSPRRQAPRNMTSKRCIISNIPYDLKWQEVKDLFRQEVGDVMYVELFNNQDGKPKGTGVIEFKDIQTAAQAIEKMHRYPIKDRKLVVREERERDRRQNDMPTRRGGGEGVMGPAPVMSMGSSNMNSGGGGGGGGGMGGGNISPQILQQLGIDGPLSNIVFVSNLDYKVNWKKLKDVFRLAGNVLRAEIKEDRDGKSRGMGTVTFETPVEAVQAVSMFNNQSLFDRTMRVKMDGQASGGRQEPLPSGLKGVGPALNNLTQMSSMDMGMGMGGSGMGLSGMCMDNMRGGMGNMDSGMNRMGSNMTGMGSMGMSGMGNMSGMGSNMSGMGGMSGMGSMGSGMGGMGMGNDSYSGMSGMGSSGMGTGSMGGMNDSFGMSSMGSGMGGSSNYSSLMDSSRGSGMGNYSSSGSSSRMDYGRDSGRSGGGSSGIGSGDMKTRADKSTIIVKNLPYSMDWQTLKAKFQSIGDIRFAEISKNDKGKSNGWGLVSFRKEDDAQLAVQKMNRVNIDGRDVVVKLLN